MSDTTSTSDGLVLVDATNGITVIPQLSELRRLNWFDGKLLRADDLRVEQDHVRSLVRRANRAGGHGVVEGFTVTLGGDGPLHVGPGAAIDPSGRSLLLPVDVTLDIADLIAKTAGKGTPAGGYAAPAKSGFGDCVQPQSGGQAQVGGGQWYVISVGWAEGLCGNEEVFGGMCEAACTTSTDRPWRMDGLVFRARAITPRTALRMSSAVVPDGRHERSLVASALFADEYEDAGSLIFGSGLRSHIWCSGAAAATAAYDEVPLALIGRSGSTTRFLDMWIARRERMEAPPRGYWAGRMSMRPWNVFLAQVLQFQCQLADVLDGPAAPASGGFDPCAERQKLLDAALHELEGRPSKNTASDAAFLKSINDQMLTLKAAAAAGNAGWVLIDRGIVELPPAGYLPVDPSLSKPVRDQVAALLGAGVDLTFCTTRHDAVAHLFEEAQHLERISLLTGLDSPKQRQAVEIVIPDAASVDAPPPDGWSASATFPPRGKGLATAVRSTFDGAGRVGAQGDLGLLLAGKSEDDPGISGLFAEVALTADPFTLGLNGTVECTCTYDLVSDRPSVGLKRRTWKGSFKVGEIAQQPDPTIHGVLKVEIFDSANNGDDPFPIFGTDGAPATLVRREADGVTTYTLSASHAVGSGGVTLAFHDDSDVELALLVKGRAEVASEAMAPMAGATPDLGAEIATLRLRREPGAGAPGGKQRVTADAALKRLGAALQDATYLPRTTQRLFPAVDPGTPQLQATRDWVLFRRRARLSCGGLAIHNAASCGMLTIYSSLPFRGSQRPQTVDIEKGIKLALKEAGNKAGAFTIKYVSNDDSSAQTGTWSAENVSANAGAAAQDESTAVYIGEFNSGGCAISIPILSDAHVPQISPSSTALGLTSDEPGAEPGAPAKYYPSGFRNFTRIVPKDTIQAAALVTIMKRDRCMNLAMANDKEVYGAGLARNIEIAAKSQDLNIIFNQGIDPKAPNYRSLASKAKTDRADCFVFAGITSNNGVQIYKDFSAALPRAKLYGPDGVAETGFTDPKEGGIPASVAKKVKLTVATLSPESYGATGKKFFAAFAKEYGEDHPNPYAIYGYEAMSLALDAIERSQTGKREDIVKALFATKDRDSVLGNYSIDENGDTTLTDYGVYGIDSGQMTFIEKVATSK